MARMRILFLCTGNSCRSQMAEGWTRALHSDTIEAFSAGTQPSVVNPVAIQVMSEVGVDLSSHRSKHVREFLGQRFDYVITLCGDARDNCPVFPGQTRRVHMGFPDPARACGSPEEIQREFRRVRDRIRDFVAGFPGVLLAAESSTHPAGYPLEACENPERARES